MYNEVLKIKEALQKKMEADQLILDGFDGLLKKIEESAIICTEVEWKRDALPKMCSNKRVSVEFEGYTSYIIIKELMRDCSCECSNYKVFRDGTFITEIQKGYSSTDIPISEYYGEYWIYKGEKINEITITTNKGEEILKIKLVD